MPSIFYYDKSGKVQSTDFDRAFNSWVIDSGGQKATIRAFKAIHPLKYDNIPVMFLLYFQAKYDAEMPENDDKIFQDYLYDPDTYIMRVNRLIRDHKEKSLSPSNIAWIVVVSIVILCILSTCG